MRTPPLRRRMVRAGVMVVTALLLVFDTFVFLSVRHRLEESLSQLLADRAAVAERLGGALGPEELAEQLTALGVPATVRPPDGRELSAEPATPRMGAQAPPARVAHPRIGRITTLPDGTVVEVFATRAGVDATLRNLLTTVVVATLAAMLLAFVLLRRAATGVVAPLEEVAATAERITAGVSGERLQPDQPGTELGRMAAAFDEMLDALEAAVARAEREQERARRFLADAAHQLRTPLAGIRAATELLLQESDPEARDRLIAGTVRETTRVNRLVTSLLHVARLDEGALPRRERTDVVRLCQLEADRVRGFAPHLEIAVTVDEPRPAALDAEAAELQEAVANLVDNARRHARHRLGIHVSQRDGQLAVRVEDDGPGVPEGAEELVFERFTTLDGRGGSGLGLAIARGVARAHGGDLTYEDGVFVLRLPVVSPDWT